MVLNEIELDDNITTLLNIRSEQLGLSIQQLVEYCVVRVLMSSEMTTAMQEHYSMMLKLDQVHEKSTESRQD